MDKLFKYMVKVWLKKDFLIVFLLIFLLSQNNILSNSTHIENSFSEITCCNIKNSKCKCCEVNTTEIQCKCTIIPNEPIEKESAITLIPNSNYKPIVKSIENEVNITSLFRDTDNFYSNNPNHYTQPIYIIIQNLLI